MPSTERTTSRTNPRWLRFFRCSRQMRSLKRTTAPFRVVAAGALSADQPVDLLPAIGRTLPLRPRRQIDPSTKFVGDGANLPVVPDDPRRDRDQELDADDLVELALEEVAQQRNVAD